MAILEVVMAEPTSPFAVFLESPTAENYLRVFRWVTGHAAYDPYASPFDKIHELLRQRRFQDAQERLARSMPNYLLSPAAHLCAAEIFERQGDRQLAEFEQFLAYQCVMGLRQTGDGSQERPYLVTHLSDEYDLAAYLGKQPAGHPVAETGPRHCEVLPCDDGSQLWFDVTALVQAGRRGLDDSALELPEEPS